MYAVIVVLLKYHVDALRWHSEETDDSYTPEQQHPVAFSSAHAVFPPEPRVDISRIAEVELGAERIPGCSGRFTILPFLFPAFPCH